MTVEELKKEAKKLGYNVIKKPEYTPHKLCACGHRGKKFNIYDHLYSGDAVKCPNKVAESIVVGLFIKCPFCNTKTREYFILQNENTYRIDPVEWGKLEDAAWREWNSINDYVRKEKENE